LSSRTLLNNILIAASPKFKFSPFTITSQRPAVFNDAVSFLIKYDQVNVKEVHNLNIMTWLFMGGLAPSFFYLGFPELDL
jgi:hypothetical protein